jgi:FkbM family methyltransferase
MLVYDLGMHNGFDTDHYLRRGFKVIAVEANPYLCNDAQRRFQLPIMKGDLAIINAAISNISGIGDFHINEDNTQRSSLYHQWAGARVETVPVQQIKLGYLIEHFGVPDFLKSDIEGADGTVLEQLRDGGWRPRYVSVEDCRFGLVYLKLMHECGYTGFKLSNQRDVLPGTSGPLGDQLPGEWFSYDGMVIYYLATVRDRGGNQLNRQVGQWWDIHCTCEE